YEEHEKYIEKLQKTLKEKEVLLNEKKCAAEKATQDFNQKGELEKKLEDFTRIIEIRKKDEQRQSIHQKALEVEAELIRKQSEQKKWLDEIAQHEKEMNAISQHHINIELLSEIKEWYVQDTLLKKELDEKNRAVLQLEEEMQQCWQEKNTALLESGFVADLEFTEALKQLTIRQAAIEQEKETLTRKLDALKWQVELSRLRQHLVEGEPCPLCGSLEHSITEKHSPLLLEKVTEKQEELKTIEKKLHLILSLQSKITHLAQRFGEAQLNKQEREGERDEKYKAYQDHQAKFYWGDFSIYDQPRVEKLIKEYHQQQTTLQKYRETLTDLRKKLDLTQQHVHQLDVKFATQQQEVLGLEKYIEEEKSKLQVLDYFSFTSRPIPDLENNLQKGREKLTAIEQNFVRTREELNQAEIEFNNVNSKIINEQEAARKLSRTINSLQATLDEKMASNPFFENEQQLEAMMSEQIQPIKLQQEILAYYEKKAHHQDQLEKKPQTKRQ
ncbi:MAG: hypothetical protein NZ521_09860, partial [Flammeovirgaceae bacterium]|nr:hypothetical protein [Flammeovirgaceae bacterium]